MYTISPYTNLLMRDSITWEKFDDKDMLEHYENIHALYTDRISELENPRARLSEYEERELLFMLESLLQAKRYIERLEKNVV